MRLKKLHIKGNGFKNLKNIEIDFEQANGISVLIGNNGSGKSNLLEAISNIFAHLYKPVEKLKPVFDYELTYEINGTNIFIDFTDDKYSYKIDNVDATILEERYLPKQVIANYSGEESRLWEHYYKPFYDDYTKGLKDGSQGFPKQHLMFVNKYYWNIALLTFFFYEFEGETPNTDIRDFCVETLGIEKINKVYFEFDTTQIKKWQNNPIKAFVEKINPDNKSKIEYNFEDFKKVVPDTALNNQRYLFNLLASAFMPKDYKLITKIDLFFGEDDLSVEVLSEGEKKLILVQSILETLSEADSLILFDEPDSHIHISRKPELKNMFEKYSSRDNILTTHSPTLAHSFDLENINMLSNENGSVSIIEKEKQEIISQLTDGIWSYQEQNIFLNSTKDLILVEGKTDEIHIKTALEKLKEDHPEYQDLDFEFLPFGGADGLKLFVDKFTPRENQKIIAFLDRDDAGLKGVKKATDFNGSINEFNGINKNGIEIRFIPKKDGFTKTNFVIEDYYSIEKFTDFLLKDVTCFEEIPKKDKRKTDFANETSNFDKAEFEGFKKLFDLILEIKAS
jgi:predicted ATP-dependent endonuclease of OLD family